MDNFQLIVGSAECPINTVVSIIRTSSLVKDEWSTLAMELDIESHQISKLRQDLLLNKITSTDLILTVIESWIGKSGSHATLGKLLKVVEKQCGAKDVGEFLRLQFNLQCQTADDNPSIEWNDIPPVFQKLVTETFQSFFPTLDFSETLPKLKGPSLIKLMTRKKPPLFEHPFPDKLCYYINRTLITRNFISREIFYQDRPDIFLFAEMDPSELSGLAGYKLTGSSGEQLRDGITVKFMILDKSHHFERICEKTSSPLHLLQKESDGRLRWIKSSDKMDNLQKYVDSVQDELDEESFCKHLDSHRMPVCICDSPGMGKSFLLAQIGNRLSQMYPDRAVLFIVFSEFIKQAKSMRMEDDIKMLSSVFKNWSSEIQSTINSDVGAISFELLLDGFDEVDSTDRKLAHRILQTITTSFKCIRLWVTSRPHLMEELESNLNLLGYNIRPFLEEDQVNFLSAFWTRKDVLDKLMCISFAQHCLKSLKSTMDSLGPDIAGIPLQCLLIGEVYEQDALEYARLENRSESNLGIEIGTITNLYRRLIKKKILKYESLYGDHKLDELHLMTIHARLSLELLFPKVVEKLIVGTASAESDMDEVLKVGIVTATSRIGSSFTFTHRTFAEYFVAWFVVDKIRKEGQWTKQLDEFFHSSILECRKSVPESVINILYPTHRVLNIFDSTSYQFNHQVICYFLNSIIADLEITTFPTHFSTQLDEKIVHACANANFVHIFKLLDECNAFKESASAIFTVNVLLLSIAFSGLELLKPLLTHWERNSNYYASSNFKLTGLTAALRMAVRLGKFSIVEFLIKEKQLAVFVEEGHELTSTLVHNCMEYSEDCSKGEIYARIEVLRMIVGINRSMVNVTVMGRAPILAPHAHVKLIVELINLGANVLAEDEQGTIIHLTWGDRYFSSEDYHSLLLSIPEESFRQLIHVKDRSQGYTPLKSLLLKIEPTPETLEKFRRADVDYNLIDKARNTKLLTTAIKGGRNAETIRRLVQFRANILEGGKVKPTLLKRMLPSQGKPSKTLLRVAAEYGNVEAVRLLVNEYGMSIKRKDENGLTPFESVIENFKPDTSDGTISKSQNRGLRNGDYLKVLEFLLSKGVNINLKNKLKQTPLHLAASSKRRGNMAVIKFLIENGANLYAKDKHDCTFLHHFILPFPPPRPAAFHEMVTYLLGKGLHDLFSIPGNKFESTPLLLAVRNFEPEMKTMELLHSNNVNFFATDKFGQSILANAITCHRSLKFISALIKKSPLSLHEIDKQGNSLLHKAAENQFPDHLRFFLELRALDVNKGNHKGDTPLHMVAREEKWKNPFDKCKLLLEYGADANILNRKGETPLAIVMQKYDGHDKDGLGGLFRVFHQQPNAIYHQLSSIK